MTRDETLDLLRTSGLTHIAIVLEQTRSQASSSPRAYERAQPAGALLAPHQRRPPRRPW